MKTVFIAGSISISRLHEKVQERIHKIISSNLNVVVGDANGIDTSVQKCLYNYQATKVTVYCTGDVPRNNIAQWPVYKIYSNLKPGSRAYFTAKDLEMARNSDFGLMIWDCKSTGTLSNIIELLRKKKKSVVFINKNKEFMTISDKFGLEYLLTFMSAHARAKAEEKINLSSKIASLAQEQLSLDVSHDEVLLALKAEPNAQEFSDDNPPHMISIKLRLALMSVLKKHIIRTQLSQLQAAQIFGVTQPRISDLTRGKVDLFGLDTLVNMAETAGLHIEMQIQETIT